MSGNYSLLCWGGSVEIVGWAGASRDGNGNTAMAIVPTLQAHMYKGDSLPKKQEEKMY